MARKNWSEEETLMAFALYRALRPSECDDKNRDVQALAAAIGRTPNAVALKIWNIAAHDQQRIAKGKVGLRNGSKLDALVWEWYAERGDDLFKEAIDLLDQRVGWTSDDGSCLHYMMDDTLTGENILVVATRRANQSYFRESVLEAYEHTCCLTGMDGVDQLLVASHIKPWRAADPKTERLATSNGLLLNALHDKAFDRGLMTIGFDYRAVVSKKVPKDEKNALLWSFAGREIRLPKEERLRPARDFLEYHHDIIFQG